MTPWLPEDFTAPGPAPVPPDHHVRQIRATDVDLDFAAVMSSRERLWSLFGAPHGWPTETLTHAQDRADLARHEAEMERNLSFNYALFDAGEHYLGGCIYIDPPERTGADADISYWVVDDLVGTPVAAALAAMVPRWIATYWPFTNPRIIDSERAWAEWLRLPPCQTG